MKNTLKSELKLFGAILFVGICSTASAQVATGVSSGVNSKLNAFLYVVTGVSGILFTYCTTMAGYKFATSENTKFTDLRGLLIGGTLAGTASAIAYALIS
jgi:hypothetical protein